MPVKEVFSNAERTIPSTPLREGVPQAHGQRSCPKDEYGFDLALGSGSFGTPRIMNGWWVRYPPALSTKMRFYLTSIRSFDKNEILLNESKNLILILTQ